MALVYSHSAQDTPVMNYYQREQQPPLSGVVSSTANTECTQALCFYDANQQLINVTVRHDLIF
jgi:hypothetical protein